MKRLLVISAAFTALAVPAGASADDASTAPCRDLPWCLASPLVYCDTPSPCLIPMVNSGYVCSVVFGRPCLADDAVARP
jgi:hypothetical protein